MSVKLCPAPISCQNQPARRMDAYNVNCQQSEQAETDKDVESRHRWFLSTSGNYSLVILPSLSFPRSRCQIRDRVALFRQNARGLGWVAGDQGVWRASLNKVISQTGRLGRVGGKHKLVRSLACSHATMQLRQCVVRALALLLLLDSVQTFMARFGRQAVHNWLRPAGRPVLAKLALRLATHVEGEPRIPSSLSLRLDVYVPRNARNRSALHQTPVRLEKVIDAASKGRVSEAVRLFERVAPSNDKVMQLKQCNILLRALGDCGALSACDHVLQGFDRLGLQPNIVTICTLISRAGTAKKPEAARHYFQLMKTFKIAPDVASFNALGSAYAKSGNVSAALRILPAILQGGLSPTIITFNTLLDACARSGDVKQAEHIFALIANFPIQPTSYTYSSLAHAYTKARDPEGGTRVLRRMVRAGIEPGAVIYTTLIDAYGSAGIDHLSLLSLFILRGIYRKRAAQESSRKPLIFWRK